MNPNSLFRDDLAAVTALIDGALAKGYSCTVHDGEGITVRRSVDRAQIIAALGTTDEDRVRFHDAGGSFVGSVFLVYGNRDGTTIADYHDKPEITALAEAAMREAEAATGIH